MDALPGPPARPETGRIDVRIADLGELAASIPQLLGFRAGESVVLISLTGARGTRVGLTVRVDLPPPPSSRAVADQLARKVLTDRPRAVVVAVVSEAPDPGGGALPHQAAVRDVVTALAAHAVPVPAVLLVRGGRWWSYDCPDPCCAPGRGTPLPDGVTALEAAAVASGVVVERDRGALAARIRPPDAAARAAMAVACAEVAGECVDAVLVRGWDAVAEESWTAVLDALARSRPGPAAAATRLTDRALARLLWGLRDVDVRDRALQLALGVDAAAAEQLWTECTRRAPAPLDAAPATLLAVSSWLRGDGAMADIALTRALEGTPDYTLARLLAEALSACLPPAELRGLIRRTASERVG